MSYLPEYYLSKKYGHYTAVDRRKPFWDRKDVCTWDVVGGEPQPSIPISLAEYEKRAKEFQEVYDWIAEVKSANLPVSM